ncbi:MAG: hydroxymethylbilane synthase [Desulfobacteraceae bacterium]|jgi:hydroxymethylbilane synthase
MGESLIIGTRGSKLALWQAHWVKSEIEKKHPELNVELSIIKTKGDKILDVPLAKVGGKGLFVKEIEDALLSGKIDLAIHSMKDVPAEIPEGLCIGAIPLRENPQDVILSKNNLQLMDLPERARVGTSSLRRSSQLKKVRPDLTILPLRGNIDTRLKKLDEGEYDAIVLAAAGVRRLGFENRISQYLEPEEVLPSVGQGALCIEIRIADSRIEAIVSKLNHADTNTVVSGERSFLHRLEGGCQIPIAAHGQVEGKDFTLTGLVADLTGETIIKETITGPREESVSLGITLADRLLARGAKTILDQVKEISS